MDASNKQAIWVDNGMGGEIGLIDYWVSRIDGVIFFLSENKDMYAGYTSLSGDIANIKCLETAYAESEGFDNFCDVADLTDMDKGELSELTAWLAKHGKDELVKTML